MFKDLDADLYVLLFAKHSAKDLDPNIILVQNPFQGQVTIDSELSHMMDQSRDKPKVYSTRTDWLYSVKPE